MKYEKPQIEVINYDFSEFMTGSGNETLYNYTDEVGHVCGTYVKGSSCSSWTTPSFGGGNCSNYNGHKCYGYTDGTHSNCTEYGTTCAKF